MPRNKKVKTVAELWRNSNQLRGVKSNLTAALNQNKDGAYVQLDTKMVRNLIEICDQAIHTEEGHEPTPFEEGFY